MKPHPCRHLDHDEARYPDCKLRTAEPHYPNVRYWERPEWMTAGNPPGASRVQFCKLRGRINEVFACYLGELPCYDPEPKP